MRTPEEVIAELNKRDGVPSRQGYSLITISDVYRIYIEALKCAAGHCQRIEELPEHLQSFAASRCRRLIESEIRDLEKQ